MEQRSDSLATIGIFVRALAGLLVVILALLTVLAVATTAWSPEAVGKAVVPLVGDAILILGLAYIAIYGRFPPMNRSVVRLLARSEVGDLYEDEERKRRKDDHTR